MRSGASIAGRLGILGVVLVLLIVASLRWAAQDGRSPDGVAYIAMALGLIALTAGLHLLAVRYPERPAVEGAAWVLTVVVVVAVGLGALAMAVSPGDTTSPLLER